MIKNEIAQQIDEGIHNGLNLQEISWCETFLRTASIRQACKEALIDLDTAGQMTSKPEVQRYILSKTLAYKNESAKLDRTDLKKILNVIAQDPTTNPDLRIRAVSKLDEMLSWDLEHKGELLENSEEVEDIKLTAEEADEMLRQMRNKEEKL